MDEKQENAGPPETCCQSQKQERPRFYPCDQDKASAALLGLQAAVAGGEISREAAIAHVTAIFGIDPKDARKLFPAPKK